jgi:membrane-associated phospholipid phosphatase
VRNSKRPFTSYNRFFLLPFLVWIVVGAILLIRFDRRVLFGAVNMNHTEALDSVMYALTNLGDGIGIIFVLLLLVAIPKLRNWWYAVAAIACNAIPAIIIQILKGVFDAPRPFEYYKGDDTWIHFSEAWGEHLHYHSFPSGHSAGAFSLFCFLSCLLPRRYQWVGIPLFLLALTVGYTRMYLAAHFYADVYVGSVIGTVVTLACFSFVRRLLPKFYGVHEAEMSVADN